MHCSLRLPMSLGRLLFSAIGASLIAGCAFESLGKPTFTEADVQAKVEAIREVPKTRAGVHELLGEPWIADDHWRVEVFRVSGKQRKTLIVFAPYPFPIPEPSARLKAYTLVAYSEAGTVNAVDGGFTNTDDWSHRYFRLQADDYTFVHDESWHDVLSVSQRRFLRDDEADRATTCTVMFACESRPCWNRIQVDGGKAREFPVDPFTFDENMAPVSLPYGMHQLRFSSAYIVGELSAELSCSTTGLIYAVQTGGVQKSLSAVQQIFSGFKAVAASGSVEFQPALPESFVKKRVILNVDGEWVVPAAGASMSR
jgi:hypothetical protein